MQRKDIPGVEVDSIDALSAKDSLRLSDSVVNVSGRRTMMGVLVMSFASLLLELSLTRLFSVVLFYHFAFLAISIALLGLGAGGVFSYLLKKKLECWTV